MLEGEVICSYKEVKPFCCMVCPKRLQFSSLGVTILSIYVLYLWCKYMVWLKKKEQTHLKVLILCFPVSLCNHNVYKHFFLKWKLTLLLKQVSQGFEILEKLSLNLMGLAGEIWC